MNFEETSIPGVWVVDLERREDPRGFFARTFCEDEFANRGLLTRFVQCNLSSNARRGTLRGMHWQNEPKPEVKLVRCVRGSVYDVVIDLRRDSPTYCKWIGVELSAANGEPSTFLAVLRMGFRRSRTIPTFTTTWASSIIPLSGRECDGTIRPSASHGHWAIRCSRTKTRRIRTTSHEFQARSGDRRIGIYWQAHDSASRGARL
jgi:dTDP-4-dehydrorhamnose 3,5-epimerase-like enzyme